jgi:hypothetical protein
MDKRQHTKQLTHPNPSYSLPPQPGSETNIKKPPYQVTLFSLYFALEPFGAIINRFLLVMWFEYVNLHS